MASRRLNSARRRTLLLEFSPVVSLLFGFGCAPAESPPMGVLEPEGSTTADVGSSGGGEIGTSAAPEPEPETGSSSASTSSTTAVEPESSSTSDAASSTGESPGCRLDVDCAEGVCVAGRCVATPQIVVFLNGDGVVLSEADARGDATMDQVPAGFPTGTIAPADPSRFSSLAAQVEALFGGYSIDFVTARPSQRAYMMVVVTSDPSPFSGVYSLAPLDCRNANGSDVALVFDDVATAPSIDRLSRATAFAIGNMLGVHPVDDPADLMFPTAEDGEASFLDQCSPLVGDGCDPGPITCRAGFSNSHQELLLALDGD